MNKTRVSGKLKKKLRTLKNRLNFKKKRWKPKPLKQRDLDSKLKKNRTEPLRRRTARMKKQRKTGSELNKKLLLRKRPQERNSLKRTCPTWMQHKPKSWLLKEQDLRLERPRECTREL
jgi:hypothetical protein